MKQTNTAVFLDKKYLESPNMDRNQDNQKYKADLLSANINRKFC